jgi:Uncharacterized protein conserved in bacteria
LVLENKAKKQIPLRLSPELYNALMAWAEDEFRSVNGQIEYLLHECVKKRVKGKSTVPSPSNKKSETARGRV